MQDKKQSLVPELRFPGFEGEWEMKKLGDIACLKNGYAFKSDNYVTSGKYKIVTIANVKNGEFDIDTCNTIDILPENIASHQKLTIGDIVISMTGNVGRVCLIDQPYCLLNQRVGLLDNIDDCINKDFFYHIINSRNFENAMILSAQGAAQPNIGKSDIESYVIAFPSLPEQQKIAECLSSVDDLIQAEADQLQALKDHKKGLMQQLFPQEGETTPKLRFPGFEGEWEEKKLGEVANFQNGYAYNSSTFSDKGNYVIRISDIKDGTISLKSAMHSLTDVPNAFKVVKGDILIAMSGATTGKIGEYKNDEVAYINQRVGNIKPFAINKKLLLFLLQSDFFMRYLNGILTVGAQPNISSQQICSFGFMLPPTPTEQQKIADCLSSLDEEISAQQQKVEALKEHKKGLMQKLFPSV